MRILFCFAAILFLGAASHVGVDGGGSQPPAIPDDTKNRVDEILSRGGGPPAPPEPTANELAFLDDDGKAVLIDSLEAYYRYRLTAFEHRRAVFDWQFWTSKEIFFVVIGIVLIGVYFSWMQFLADPPKKSEDGKPDNSPVTTFEWSLKGFKVTSPVLGVVILALSLGFFYLYLVHVYPIVEVF